MKRVSLKAWLSLPKGKKKLKHIPFEFVVDECDAPTVVKALFLNVGEESATMVSDDDIMEWCPELLEENGSANVQD